MTKYNETDGLTELEAEDDAAHVLWGGNWNTPTQEQMQELISNCTWTWGTVNEINGYTVSGNGNSIFLPAAGYCSDARVDLAGTGCFYWLLSLYSSDIKTAYRLSGNSNAYQTNSDWRFRGLSIRPVISIPSNEPNALYKPIELVIGGSGNEPTPITWNRQTEKYEAHLYSSFTGSDIDIYMNELMDSYEDVRSVVFSNMNGVTIDEQQAVNNFFNQGRLFISAGVVSSPDAGEKSFDTTVTFRDGSSWTLAISWTQEAVA